MRLLIDRRPEGEPDRVGSELTETEVRAAYAVTGAPWLRASMVSTVDGAAAGADDRSGSINTDADHVVFAALRSLADAVVVGAGTADTEGYGPVERPIVLVSARGRVPDALRGGPAGSVLLATCGTAAGLETARAVLGEDAVLVVGHDEVDLPGLVRELHRRGLRHLLCEGGPHLLGDLLAAGLVDELCATLAPSLVAGGAPRITAGAGIDQPVALTLLLEHEGTLMARWRLR